jgi:tRNA(fMet)-specific endonuclease VapC
VICIDTDALIHLVRGRATPKFVSLASRLQRFAGHGHEFATTRINLAALYVGIHLSPEPAEEERKILSTTSTLATLEFDETAARLYGRIDAAMRRAGTPVGEIDAQVAGIALARSCEILTSNRPHFSRFPGLVVHTY